MKKVLITDNMHISMQEGLQAMGYEVHFRPKINDDAVMQILPDYYGLVVRTRTKVTQAMLECAWNLNFVARLGSGLENIDVAYAKSRGIKVFNSPEGNANAVGEHALAMLLSYFNKIPQANTGIRRFDGGREIYRGEELKGKTVGIIGFGHTGSAFARKLSGLDVKVLAYDKYKENYTDGFPHVEATDLAVIQANADIISLHLPLTKETKHLVDYSFLYKCKKGHILINTARGEVVKTLDLLFSLFQNQTKAACLDVLENEDITTYSPSEKRFYEALFTMENLLITPHVAGWTSASKIKLVESLLDKIALI